MTTVEVPHGSRSAVLRVAAVIAETADSCSLVFDVPEDLTEKFAYRPGQFLTLRIPSDLTGSVARCYSLASSPYTDDKPNINVSLPKISNKRNKNPTNDADNEANDKFP